jgi:uncharacterized protein YceH (UPF0502 family)
VQRNVNDDLLKSTTGKEGSDRVNVRNEAFQGKTARHPDYVLLRNPFHQNAIRILGHRFFQHSSAKIRAEEYNSRICLNEFGNLVKGSLTHDSPLRAAC